eukprot:2694309-Rhodomonas_salina.4
MLEDRKETGDADLANAHSLIADLFSDDASTAQLLSAEQLEQYERDGFMVGPRILNDKQIEALREELSELTCPDHPGSQLWYEYNSNESVDPEKVLFHALGAWRLRPALHDILWDAKFTVPASQLLGGSVRFWHDQVSLLVAYACAMHDRYSLCGSLSQLFCKPALHGGVVAWHQVASRHDAWGCETACGAQCPRYPIALRIRYAMSGTDIPMKTDLLDRA